MPSFARYAAHLLAFAALFMVSAQPAAAQSILRDAETEALLADMAAPLIAAAGLEPGNVDVVLVGDPSINAFVAGGQVVYIHSGLIDAADSANEVQGVIAHELGHITGGHINRFEEGLGQARNVTIASLILGALAAAAGSGEAAMGAIMAGQQAAMGRFLAFNRVQETSADAAGATYLSNAGITGRGSIEFFKKLENQEFRRGYSQDDSATYGRSHPLSGDRISLLQQTYQADPAWDNTPDAELQERFLRAKAKLFGYLNDPQTTQNRYPVSDTSVPARYARAFAWHKAALMDNALDEADALIASDPSDPYFHELKGQVLLESGKPDAALESLRTATELTNNQPLIASLFGHALIATEDPDNLSEAERVLRAAVALDRRNPFAWYQLGVVYDARGDEPRARLASAEQQVMRGQYFQALQSAMAAEAGLPAGSPDWLRAQDVANEARVGFERQQENGGRSRR